MTPKDIYYPPNQGQGIVRRVIALFSFPFFFVVALLIAVVVVAVVLTSKACIIQNDIFLSQKIDSSCESKRKFKAGSF